MVVSALYVERSLVQTILTHGGIVERALWPGERGSGRVRGLGGSAVSFGGWRPSRTFLEMERVHNLKRVNNLTETAALAQCMVKQGWLSDVVCVDGGRPNCTFLQRQGQHHHLARQPPKLRGYGLLEP